MPPRRSRAVRTFSNVLVALPLVAAFAIITWIFVFPDKVREMATEGMISLRPGDPVPDVVLVDAQGGRVALAGLVGPRGAAILLVDPACGHCHTEMGMLTQLLGGPRPEEPVHMVSVGSPEGTAQLRRTYPRLSFLEDAGGTLGGRYGLRGTPVLLVADGSGRLSQVRGGLQGEEVLTDVLRGLGL